MPILPFSVRLGLAVSIAGIAIATVLAALGFPPSERALPILLAAAVAAAYVLATDD